MKRGPVARPRVLTIERLREAVAYDPQTGLFANRLRRSVNAPGRQLGALSNRGLIALRLDGKSYSGHRLAWLYMTGEWPKEQIDHIDGDRTNNRWANLRDVSCRINLENLRKATRRSTTGLLGAHPDNGRFSAKIQVNKRAVYLGCFATPESAHAAYLVAKRSLHEGCTI